MLSRGVPSTVVMPDTEEVTRTFGESGIARKVLLSCENASAGPVQMEVVTVSDGAPD